MADLQHPTQQFRIMPDEGITMSIVLTDEGDAMVHLNGETWMPCWCGESHLYTVTAEFKCSSTMDPLDMNDMDAAVRGVPLAARRLGWRLMHKIFFCETPPCEQS